MIFIRRGKLQLSTSYKNYYFKMKTPLLQCLDIEQKNCVYYMALIRPGIEPRITVLVAVAESVS